MNIKRLGKTYEYKVEVGSYTMIIQDKRHQYNEHNFVIKRVEKNGKKIDVRGKEYQVLNQVVKCEVKNHIESKEA